MEFHGETLWNSMELFHGIPWNYSMEFHGNFPWNSMEFHGVFGHGILWNSMEKLYGTPWNYSMVYLMETFCENSMELFRGIP